MNELEFLKRVISEVVRYNKTYLAKVISDADVEKKGRVLVIIPALGIITPAEGVWADVEQPIGKNVIPAPDDWVSVYFLDGDPSKPVVRGKTTIAKDNVPSTEAKKQLLYKDDDTEIMLDQLSKKLIVKYAGDMEINCDKKVDITITGDVTINNEGKADIKIKGDTNIECDGNINVKGSKVTINDHLEVS